MCSNYPGIKLELALLREQDEIEHLSSYVFSCIYFSFMVIELLNLFIHLFL